MWQKYLPQPLTDLCKLGMMGSRKLSVSNTLLTHIDRDYRHCAHCATNRNTNIMEDGEHVVFYVLFVDKDALRF